MIRDAASAGLLDGLPFVRERYEQAGGTSTHIVAEELDRFFRMTLRVDCALAVISRDVDELWHRLLEFTEFYEDFCRARYGHMIHHRPRTKALDVAPAAVRNFYDAYQSCYGPVPAIWERGAPPALVAYGRRRIDCMPDAVAWSGWPGRERGGT